MPSPYPAERLNRSSSQEDIRRAVEDTIAQMTAEGIPQQDAQQQAFQMAQQSTSGGNTKLRDRRVVGNLFAGRDSGLSTPQGGPYGSTGF